MGIFFRSLYCLLVVMISLAVTGGEIMALEIKSPEFKEGEYIPIEYTGMGEDISPALNWANFPKAAKSFALICDDPDAPGGDWVHWVIYDIPVQTNSLDEGVLTMGELELGIKQGKNDFGRIGYGGPMPPPGAAHRYFFKIYALDKMLNLEPGLTKPALLNAIEGHILENAQLIGRFKR
ncbi:MAG: YbhB/YbcL family Raf kinase inhibitor-like protein [Candidatus Omnitrophota bacterium]